MELIEREITIKIKRWLDRPDIIVLLGARQVGKTSIMRLLESKMKENEFAYYDLEDTYNLELLSSVDKFIDNLKAKGLGKVKRLNVFIDEIQYLQNPSNFLKLIHDHHPEIKLIVSGSSSLDIRRKFTDGLTGRKIIFEIYPLSFKEYLRFKKSEYEDIKNEIYLEKVFKDFEKIKPFSTLTPKILPLFEEYAIFGGYPLPTLTTNYEDKIMRLKDIHNTYIQKDIRDLARIENIVQFNRMVSYISVQISNLLNLNEVSKEVGISRRDTENYISILEKTFIIGLLKPYYKNRQKEITKMPKLFFTDTGLRNININDMRLLEIRPDKGALVENAFYQEIIKQKEILEEFHFWRTKDGTEVDFISVKDREIIPIEIKYQNFDSPNIPSSLKTFILKYTPKRAVVVTRDYLERISYEGADIFFLPIWMI